jgi:hypothetical protein
MGSILGDFFSSQNHPVTLLCKHIEVDPEAKGAAWLDC